MVFNTFVILKFHNNKNNKVDILEFQNYESTEKPNCILLLILQFFEFIGNLNYSLGLILQNDKITKLLRTYYVA